MKTTVLRHAKLVTMNSEMEYFQDGFAAFCGNEITAFGDEKNYQPIPESVEIDVKGDIVLPAFINTHTHLGMTAFRSLGDDMPDRLNRFLFPLENQCMTSELVYHSSLLSMAEMLLSGTASCLDMYYFEDQVIQAAKKMNMRLWAGETLLDSPHCDAQDFDSSLILTEKYLPLADGDMINIVCAPHAPYSVCEENLKKVQTFAKANNILWSMHVSEMPSEKKLHKEQHNCTPIRYLADKKLMDERLIAAHCIYTDEQDMEIIAATGAKVSHCPVSNAKAAKGVAPINSMINHGINVTLGTDGPSSGNTLDMFTVLKSSVILQKNLLSDRSALPAKEILKLATCNAGRALGSKTGAIKKGFKADLQRICVSDVNMIPVHDVYSAVVYSAQSHNVKDLWVNGELTVKDHMPVKIDLSSIINDFCRASETFNKTVLELSRR